MQSQGFLDGLQLLLQAAEAQGPAAYMCAEMVRVLPRQQLAFFEAVRGRSLATCCAAPTALVGEAWVSAQGMTSFRPLLPPNMSQF